MELNPNIVPLKFPPRGKHAESRFQEDLRTFFHSRNVFEIGMPIRSTNFFSFDFLGVPAYSPVRSKKNAIFPDDALRRHAVPTQSERSQVADFHSARFGAVPLIERGDDELLLSHTTALLAENLFFQGARDVFVISKTFREKKEKREKIQVEVAIVNRPLPEILAFVEDMYSFVLSRSVRLGILPDFYYFLEPSFSFSFPMEDRTIACGSWGFMRPETLDLVRARFPEVPIRTVAFVGIPYLKLLNLREGLRVNDFEVDYNAI